MSSSIKPNWVKHFDYDCAVTQNHVPLNQIPVYQGNTKIAC